MEESFLTQESRWKIDVPLILPIENASAEQTTILHFLSRNSAGCFRDKLSCRNSTLCCPECFCLAVSNWRLLLRSQLENLKSTGIADCAAIYVVISGPHTHENHTFSQIESLLNQARELVYDILPRNRGRGAFVSTVHENSFELPGLQLLWLLSQHLPPHEANSSIFLYFHTKGMTNHGLLKARIPAERFLFKGTITPWHVVDVFMHNSSVTRAGMYPNPSGFIWHNFWWARATYLKLRVHPNPKPYFL